MRTSCSHAFIDPYSSTHKHIECGYREQISFPCFFFEYSLICWKKKRLCIQYHIHSHMFMCLPSHSSFYSVTFCSTGIFFLFQYLKMLQQYTLRMLYRMHVCAWTFWCASKDIAQRMWEWARKRKRMQTANCIKHCSRRSVCCGVSCYVLHDRDSIQLLALVAFRVQKE